MNKKLSVLRRITAVVLCVTLLSSQVVVANAEDSERMNVQTNSEITDISEQDGFSSDTSEISDITESDIPDSFEGESEPNTDISSEVTEEFGNSEDQGFTDGEETIIEDENTSDTLEEANPDYEDGKICIYNYQQLLQIGTGTQMFSGDKDGNVGEGDKVLADGAELTYASDASYCLMNDIPIDNENVWNFPSDFTGSITSSSERTGNTVYDSVTDTIYVYNRYQLELMKGESSDSEPVMSEDYIAEKVGMGQVFTLEDGSYLTYSKTHNYVLASSFTTETPELLANKAGTEETTKDITSAYPSDYEGRNYFGQVVKKIGDKNYILIGNETQLRAIGTDADVTEPIWRVYETREKNEGILGGYTDWKPAADTSEYKTELYYPGDADIVKFNDTYNWSGKELYANKNGAHKLNDTEYLDNQSWDIAGTKATQCYVYVSSTIQESADMTVTATESTASDSEAASVEADETVNDSDLIDMIPSDSEEAAETGSDDAEAFTSSGDESGFTDDIDSESITVDENKTYVLTYATSKHSNTNIAGSGYKYSKDANYIIFRDIDLSKAGTNSNGEDDNWDPIDNYQGNMEGRKGMVEGQSITISHINISQANPVDQDNQAEYGIGFFRNLTTPYSTSLTISQNPITVKNITLSDVTVSTTTTKVKQNVSLIGSVLKLLLGNLSGLKPDPQSLATGGFAGVVKGNIQIENCNVENLHGVSNVNDRTGGFAGYISGMTQYDLVSSGLGGLVGTLTKILNLIPLLGVGDLLTVLLKGGLLSVDKLIPVGYVNPSIQNCSVSGGTSVTGQKSTGGFAGEAIGAVMKNCSVGGTTTVSGNDCSGGFVGRSANAVVAGALSSLGIEVMGNFPVNTVMLNCRIDGAVNVSAQGTPSKESGYAGGFIGEMRNSYAVDCSISSLGTVSGKDYTGGFAGIATLGDVADIDESQGLLVIVKDLLTGLLNGKFTNMDLLNLVGLRPSVISGCTIAGDNISVTANGKNAGGLVGYAGAVQISNTSELTDDSKSTTKALQRVLNKTGVTYEFADRVNQINAASSVKISATENAGGILGYAKMTSVGDVLGGTVTAADYMRFECKDCSVNGGSLGLTVTASDKENGRAGGAIGYGTGGEVRKISVTNLNSVTAGKCAGGFAGYFGSGTLANVGGIKLLGLPLLKIDSLLSVGQMIETFTVDSTVSGVSSGYSVFTGNEKGYSGGFIGECISGRARDTKISNLKTVTASATSGKAGGFAGFAKAGDALSAGDSTTSKLTGIELENLLGVVSALRPEFNNTSIAYVSNGSDPQVSADMAGGFLGEGQAVDINYGNNNSGFKADTDTNSSSNGSTGEKNSEEADFISAVTNSENETTEGETGAIATTNITGLSYIKGTSYAGGFAGRLMPGDVAQTGSIKLLGLLDVNQLLSVMDVAYPRISDSSIAGDSLVVTASGKNDDVALGDAGGYIGNGKAVMVKNSDVTNVKEVTAPYHAGGYIGIMRSGSAAEAGDATGDLLNSVLGKILSLKELASVLQAASSKITNCKVAGTADGLTVTADSGFENAEGYAGGFVGEMQSGHVDNSANAVDSGKGTAVENLLKVEGLRYAGGFGGLVKAGAVAEIGAKSSILTKLVDLTGLLSLVNAFVPVISNASVNSVEKGFTVTVTGTLEKDSTNDADAGSAGGFIGCGTGVQISNSDVNKLQHTGVSEPKNLQQEDGSSYYGNDSAYAVNGYRYAGGYIGKAAMGSTAAIGGASVLDHVLSTTGLLSALTVVASIIDSSDVYGATGGFNVLATDGDGVTGKAGGYAGELLGVQIQNSNSYNFAHIIGRESAGGYVGIMEPGNAADVVNGLSALGGLIKADNLLGVLQAFVPVIKNSETTCVPCGGAVRAQAESDDSIYRGLAGGYAGYNYGGQIWGDETSSCSITNLRRVDGTSYVGGFAGKVDPGSVAAIDTATKQGLLNKLLDVLMVNAPAELIKVLNATVSIIRCASVSAWDDWGVIVNGTYQNGSNTGYAKAAGGFAGSLCGAVLGEKDKPESGIRADKIRSVVAGEYAGGCFGIADVSGAANISAGNETSVLQYLLKLGKTDVLDAFRSYVYYGNVTGSPDAGLGVSANTATKSGQNNEVTYSGTAGGFGGSLLNGSVKNSSVTGLNYVTGLNSVGGFVGYSGKSGVVKMEKLDVLGDNAGQLLGGALGVLDIFGSHIDDSSVAGIPGGYTVQSKGGEEQIAGGFIGYANLSRMAGCNAGDAQNQENSLKLVESGGTAGGFAGRTSFAYLADVKLDSTVVDALLVVLDNLVKALYLDKIQDSNLLHINLGIVKVDALYDGNLIHVNLLGLDISVGLSKMSPDNGQQTDFAIIKIGDSSIKLPCDKNGIITKDNDVKSNISVNLIKANRTKITDSNVYGITIGYNVYAGGAGNDADGTATDGRSGGFVGYNDEGLLRNNDMYYCDVVRGTSKLVGPFSGNSKLDSVYEFNTKAGVEGEDNIYRIYRKPTITVNEIKKNSAVLTDTFSQENGWSIFSVKHVVQVDTYDTLQNAVMATKDSSETADLNAYVSDAKAVLMSDAKTTVNTGDSTSPEPSDTQDPCDEFVNLTINKVWKDFRNMDGIRPDSITVTISRSWTDADGAEQTEVVPGYENYVVKGDISKSTWQEIIKSEKPDKLLPAYTKDADGTLHYYKYSVTETEIKGYTTTIKNSDDGFTFTIINRHFALLPDTGGKGIMMFIIAGGLLLAFLLYTGRRRKRKQTM